MPTCMHMLFKITYPLFMLVDDNVNVISHQILLLNHILCYGFIIV